MGICPVMCTGFPILVDGRVSVIQRNKPVRYTGPHDAYGPFFGMMTVQSYGYTMAVPHSAKYSIAVFWIVVIHVLVFCVVCYFTFLPKSLLSHSFNRLFVVCSVVSKFFLFLHILSLEIIVKHTGDISLFIGDDLA